MDYKDFKPNTNLGIRLSLLRYGYLLAICLFDTLDMIFEAAFESPRKIRDSPESQCDEWTDKKVTTLYDTTELLEDSGGSNIVRICSDSVVKAMHYPYEPQILEFIRSQTTIPVPRVRRLIKDNLPSIFVMQYIEGVTLAQCWKSLSWWSKLRVAFTLRRYVRQLRQLRNPNPDRPGPLGESPGFCEGIIFRDKTTGPFVNTAALTTFFKRLLFTAKLQPFPYGAHPQTSDYDESHPLVFCHNDLNLRNVIMGTDGTLWLIDFGFSGFYPKYFEYIAMERAERDHGRGPLLQVLIPFITDPYFKEKRWLTQVAYTMSTCYVEGREPLYDAIRELSS